MYFSDVRCRNKRYNPKNNPSTGPPINPKPSAPYVRREVNPRGPEPHAACTILPPSMEPTGRELKACATRPTHPATTSGCTSSASFDSAPSPTPVTSFTIVPRRRLCCTKGYGTATRRSCGVDPVRAKPAAKRVEAATSPLRGPDTAMSNRSLLFFTRDLKGVMEPNEVGSPPNGRKNAFPSLTSLRKAMTRCPVSWMRPTLRAPPAMALTLAKKVLGSHAATPGGIIFGSYPFAKLSGLASHFTVSAGS
mmetsp:Transcript_12449/g.23842  ORF Transcript_12449/g.23842 Transcript_12449/m.23842 type:complete len:250 (-) Transcript_12449:1292-2041(-)